MCRLLLPLLAAIALPTAVSGESYSLLLRDGTEIYPTLDKIEKKDIVVNFSKMLLAKI